MVSTFKDKSYERHSEHYKMYANGGALAGTAAQWQNPETVDYWRHSRMYSLIDPVLESYPDSRWLTVGDGRYGSDAQYLLGKGHETIASDISEYLLKEAKDLAIIPEYRVENCEALSLADGSTDFVLCKDAYHHCPRPNIALYEMIRVARQGVVLIEPQDTENSARHLHRLYLWSKAAIKSLLGKNPNAHIFEESGNYAYKLSKREVEKTCIGLDLSAFCYREINDAYLDGAGDELVTQRGPVHRKIKTWIAIQDLLCRLRIFESGYLAVLIPKQDLSESARTRLLEQGWNIVDLPRNPYISR